MTGLRERSKQRRRQVILDSAERLFRAHGSNGYSGTTIEQIAETAEVSVGTIYSFFGSKGGIMHALMHPVVERIREQGESVLESPPKRAVDAVIALYDAYRFTSDWKDVNILKALDPRSSQEDEGLGKLTAEFEECIHAQFAQLLGMLKREGRLNEQVDIEDAVYVLYMLLVGHFEIYLRSAGRLAYEDVLALMHRRVRLVMSSWT
jgi:AcrR family transcriptional regulator